MRGESAEIKYALNKLQQLGADVPEIGSDKNENMNDLVHILESVSGVLTFNKKKFISLFECAFLKNNKFKEDMNLTQDEKK